MGAKKDESGPVEVLTRGREGPVEIGEGLYHSRE